MLTLPVIAQEIVFDFESGNLADEGWFLVEGANTKPVGNRKAEFHNESVQYDKHGEFYLTTLETAEHARPTDDPMCVIESPVFVIKSQTAKLLVGGGQRPGTYIGLCVLKDGGEIETVRYARGKNSQKLDEITWDTGELVGKPVLVQAVDREQGAWAHIRFDHFRAVGNVDEKLTALRRNYVATAEQRKLEAERKQREAALQNPLVQNQPILYVTRTQYLPDHHNTATMFQTGEINTGSFRGGGSLRVWDPKDGSVTVLLDVPQGIVRDPCLSFDAKKLLVSLRRDVKDDYHIYEYSFDLKTAKQLTVTSGTKLDDTPLKQLTFMPGVSDIDPLYLPSGEIMFSATREPKYCMCNRHIMCNLYLMNGDGSNIQQVGKSTLFEGHASLTSSGQVLYDRWEYVDRNFGDAQGVWVVNPDGTNHAIYWGNNTASPGGVIDARVLPSDDSVMVCTFTSCHDRPWGAIALVDRRLGLDGKKPVMQTWPAEAVDLVDVGNYDTFIRVKQKFEDPFPLSDEWFLASGMVGRGEEMGLYLLGRDGTIALLHEDAPGCYDPTPIIATTPPPAMPNRVDLSQPNGWFYVNNVYEGYGMEHVAPGSIKYLRVVESPEKRFWTQTAWDNGTGTQAPGMTWDDFNNKQILGTVDVESDGSVYFEVPADRFLYLQLLDENGMMIQSMRSGMIARPGEQNGCTGCHESRLESVPNPVQTPIAMTKSPQKLRPWHGEERLFSYVAEVQPVFDQYCVACHDYGKTEANSQPNLAGDLNLLFNTSYVELRNRKLAVVTGAGPHVKLNPYTWGSHKSRLADVMLKGHPRKEIDDKRREMGLMITKESHPEAFGRVITWIDINAPYFPTYASAYPNNRFGRSPLDEPSLKRLGELCGVDLKWSVSFDRPELSPCLAKWSTDSQKQSPEYKEALAIIKCGQAALVETSRGEDPNFEPVITRERDQQEKYDRLQKAERLMREAIMAGQKRFEYFPSPGKSL